jgi:hypothetical protein
LVVKEGEDVEKDTHGDIRTAPQSGSERVTGGIGTVVEG